MVLPELPAQGQSPWFTPRNDWDLAVKSELEGRLSETELNATMVAEVPTVAAGRFGMSVANTGAQNKVALLNAMAAVGNLRTIQIPEGKFNLDKITAADVAGLSARVRGVGARVLGSKRWELGSANWATDGPIGTVLNCTSTLGATEAFIDLGGTVDGVSSSFSSIALLGAGAGIGLKTGDTVFNGDAGGGHPVRWFYDSLTIANFDYGMTHTGENGIMVAPYIVGCGDGLLAGYPFNGNTILAVNIERCTRSAIRLNHAMTNVFIGGVLQASYVNEATIVVENASHGNVFKGLYCENYEPTTGTHPGILHEVQVGLSGGACYGNRFEDMHWGSNDDNVRIISHNSYFSYFSAHYAPSGTTPPTVTLSGGYGHEVYGMFPAVNGASVPQSTVRLTMGVAAAEVVERAGWNTATAGYTKVGSVLDVNLPAATTSGPGAVIRAQQQRLLLDSDGTKWEPLASRINPFSNGATGAVDGIAVPAWRWYTHIRLTGATMFKLWPSADVSEHRAYHFRNGKASGDLTIAPQAGATLNGVVDATVTLAPGESLMLAVSGGGWVAF